MASFKLANRVALVTGASRGIGKAIAIAFADAGAHLALLARPGSDSALSETASIAVKRNGTQRPLTLTVDVRDFYACDDAVKQIVKTFGRLDILVNNAGLGMNVLGPYIATAISSFAVPPEIWRDIFETNVNGVFHMTRSAVPHLAANGTGRIINVTTSAATMVRPGFAPYGPSKAALDALTAIWAKELRTSRVTVNALLPGGATDTDMIPAADVADRNALIRPEVMGPPAVWLASEDAGFVTGKRIAAKDWTAAELCAGITDLG